MKKMKIRIYLILVLGLAVGGILLVSVKALAGTDSKSYAVNNAAPFTLTVSVNGVERSALVYPGRRADTKQSPVIMYFHGFSGTSKDSSQRTRFHKLWRDAIVVYPQGLKDIVDGTGNKNCGWQRSAGHLGDRDLHFVDALIDKISSRYKVNDQTIYAAGHSNGGFLTYVLLTERPSKFAAFASVGCYRANRGNLPPTTIPRPVLYIFGKEDHAFDRDGDCPNGGLNCAKETLAWLLKLNQCKNEPVKWRYPGFRKYPPEPSGAVVIWNLHKGGHSWPDHATKTIVRFFREDMRKKNPSKKNNTETIKPDVR